MAATQWKFLTVFIGHSVECSSQDKTEVNQWRLKRQNSNSAPDQPGKKKERRLTCFAGQTNTKHIQHTHRKREMCRKTSHVLVGVGMTSGGATWGKRHPRCPSHTAIINTTPWTRGTQTGIKAELHGQTPEDNGRTRYKKKVLGLCCIWCFTLMLGSLADLELWKNTSTPSHMCESKSKCFADIPWMHHQQP